MKSRKIQFTKLTDAEKLQQQELVRLSKSIESLFTTIVGRIDAIEGRLEDMQYAFDKMEHAVDIIRNLPEQTKEEFYEEKNKIDEEWVKGCAGRSLQIRGNTTIRQKCPEHDK